MSYLQRATARETSTVRWTFLVRSGLLSDGTRDTKKIDVSASSTRSTGGLWLPPRLSGPAAFLAIAVAAVYAMVFGLILGWSGGFAVFALLLWCSLEGS